MFSKLPLIFLIFGKPNEKQEHLKILSFGKIDLVQLFYFEKE